MTDGEVRWLDPEERKAWITFVAATEVIPSFIEARLRADADLGRYEYMILARLSEEPGDVVPMAELSMFVAGSLSRLSHALTRLERQDLVERVPSPLGGKRVDVRLLPAGRAKIVAAAPDHVAAVRESVIDALSPTQIRQLGRICRALLEQSAPDVARAVDEAIARNDDD